MAYDLTLTDTADAAARDLIHEGIKTFNNTHNDRIRRARQGPEAPRPLDVYVRDASGTILGGLTGYTVWDWFRVGDLWLPDDLRGKGLGSQVLQMALDEAQKRGCAHVELRTYSFQARVFYERFGFVVVGELRDFPPGEHFYWMRKDF
jgi:GNAT superfamily N-acetyltransferase